MEDVIVKLSYPIQLVTKEGTESEITTLKFGRLKAKHLKLLPKSFMKEQGAINPHEILPLIAGLGNIPIETAEELDLEDLMKIADEIEYFLSESLETGKKLSGG